MHKNITEPRAHVFVAHEIATIFTSTLGMERYLDFTILPTDDHGQATHIGDNSRWEILPVPKSTIGIVTTIDVSLYNFTVSWDAQGVVVKESTGEEILRIPWSFWRKANANINNLL